MNLRDRMNSGSPVSKPTETENEPKQTSNNITQNSNPQLQDSILQKQAEIIQKLSSENSTLRKKLQEKSETIISLNDKIGMLSSADLVLKENERLEQNNRDLKQKELKAREEASAKVSAFKKEYDQKQSELQSLIDAANDRERQAQKRIETIYKEKTKRLYALTFGGILYSILVTTFTAISSPRFSEDVLTAGKFIGSFFSALWDKALLVASSAWSLHDTIPYNIVNKLVPGVLAVLGFVAVFCGVLGLLGFVFYKIAKYYKDHFADSISALVALITFANLVWFADYLTFIKWNLIVVFILINVVYIIIRIFLKTAGNY